MTTRRSVLQGFGAGLGLAALGTFATPARAVVNDSTIPCGPFKILDILLGGAGDSLATTWFADPAEGWNTWREEPTMSYVTAAATGHNRIPYLMADGYAMNLGAGYRPLFGTDALFRSRVIAQRIEGPGVHELQCGAAMCGVGRPNFASTGARIAARYLGETDIPPSWVVSACTSDQVNQYSVATGPVGVRPFFVPTDDSFKTSLDRTARQHVDGLLATYRTTYSNWLTHGGSRARSSAFDAYEDAVNRLIDWQAVYDVVQSGPSLEGGTTMTDNDFVAAIRFAAHLLNNGARHVQVIGGFGGNPTVDLHDNLKAPSPAPIDYQFQAVRQHGAVWGAMDALRDVLDDGTLDMDDTLVFFGSEFSRRNLDNDGSEHHTAASASFVFGNLMEAPGLVGNISFTEADDPDQHGRAIGGLTHYDMAALKTMAGGVAPFQAGFLDRNRLTTPGTSDQDACDHLASTVFGVDVDAPAPPTCVGDIGIGF